MAALNKTENLIRKARCSDDPVLRLAYELTEMYFKARAELENKKRDDYEYFVYLYSKNHASFTFDHIAKYELFTSVSTLEDRRELFVKTFLHFKNTAQEKIAIFKEAAASKSE